MIQIDYALSSDRGATPPQIDLSQADAMHLRYDFFLGDLLLSANDVDFSAPWGWVPILDAAASLRWIVDELSSGKPQAVFEFTENNDVIRFDAGQSGLVCLSSTYAEGRACVSLEEFRSAVLSFGDRVLADALGRHPELHLNPHLREWYPTRPMAG